ncbi:hypothetical protein [Malikia spinosa]|uniref:hypothetical protein n=1 Tax=Malikia spinosa TaxID=86180 RepID=UPI002FD9F40F
MAYDSEYDGRMIAATRNIEGLFVAVNHFEQKRADDAARVESMIATITQLTQQVVALNQAVALLKAQSLYCGVTE